MARSLLVALVLLGAGASSSQADPVVAWPGIDTIRAGGTGTVTPLNGAEARARRAVLDLGPLYTRGELRAMARGDAVRRSVSWVVANGRRYGGGLLLAGTVVSSALFWFYDYLQSETGTALDDWYQGASGCPAPTWPSWTNDYITARREPVNTSDLQACQAGFAPRPAFQFTSTATGVQVGVFRGSSGTWVTGFSRFVAWASIPGSTMVARYEWAASEAAADWAAYLADQNIPTGSGDLDDFLAQNPSLADVLRDDVLVPYLAANSTSPDPFTFVEPWEDLPGVSFDPPLSWSIWTGDPYADSSTDSDGDGWPDWAESRLGTNPFDAASRPSRWADPDGDGWTNEQEVGAETDPLLAGDFPDTGVPEADPTDQANAQQLADLLQAIHTLEQALAGGATEAMQAAQLSVAEAQLAELRAIAEELSVTGQVPGPIEYPDVEAMLSALPELGLTLPDSPAIDAATEVGARWDPLVQAMGTKAPFAYLDVLPDPGNPQLSSSCPSFSIALFGTNVEWDLCDNPADTWMSTTGRAALTAFLTFFFLIGVVRRVATA